MHPSFGARLRIISPLAVAPLLDSLGLSLPSFLEKQCPATSDYLTTGQPLPATPCASARQEKIWVRVPIHQVLSFSPTHTRSFTLQMGSH